MKKEYNIKFKNDFDDELEQEWKNLEKNSDISFFQTSDWQKYWHINCGRDLVNIFVLLYDENFLVSILPFNIDIKYFIKVLTWNGFPFSDYNCPIIRKNFDFKNEHFELIISKIKKKYNFDYINLINNTNNNFFANKSFKVNKSYKLVFSEDLSEDIISKFEKKVNYDENRVKKMSNLIYDLNPEQETKKQIIKFFISEKQKQFLRTNAWNYLNIKRYLNYIINLHKFKEEFIDFSCLKINGKIVSSHIGYKFEKKFYYIFPVYDLNFKKYSTGNILLKKLIKNSLISNYELFDFTIGNEAYKKKLNNKEQILFDYLSHNNLRGLICVSILKLKIKLKKLFFTKKII